MKLYDTGVYLQNGQEIIPESQAQLPVSKEEAAKNNYRLFYFEGP